MASSGTKEVYSGPTEGLNSNERFSRSSTDTLSTRNSDGSLHTLRPTASPSINNSRRQRLMGFARATRDTYIPRIATSVTSLASGMATKSLEFQYDEYGSPLTFPNDTTFTLFPCYTRRVSAADSPTSESGYLVGVRGWMWCPGLMSRKNRLVLSLAKQVTKGRTSRAAQIAVDRLNHDPSLSSDIAREGTGMGTGTDEAADSESLASICTDSSTASANSVNSSVDQLIKERLGSFIARSIPKAHLGILVGSADPKQADQLCEKGLFTDINGHFECEIFTPYEPSVVQVISKVDETLTSFQEIHIVPVDGFGVISDIDDTVKLTGVIGDKRELLNKILVGSVQTWNIPEVVSWYQEISSRLGATFHYVSNSPWQLFSLINQYFDAVKLPPGSVHLKQYSGNIINSLMEPSSSRKSVALRKILVDFPQKKFICIGDSGEQDMEAYTDLAKDFPGRIIAIYIRAVPNSFSAIDDTRVLTELKWMASDWERKQAVKLTNSAIPDLIDLSENDSKTAIDRQRKLPPMVPRKPAVLKSRPVDKLPPLPKRNYLSNSASSDHNKLRLSPTPEVTDLSNPPPAPPPRRRKPPTMDYKYTHSSTVHPQSQTTRINDYTPPSTAPTQSQTARSNLASTYGVDDHFELEDVDSKAAVWIQRVQESLHDMDGTNTKLAFFEDSDEHFFKTALEDL